MNSKPTVLVQQDKTVFQAVYLESWWRKYFNIEILDETKHYNPRDTVVISDWIDHIEKNNAMELNIASKGIKYAIDHCWDSFNCDLDQEAEFVLRPREFIRINESIWYAYLGYNKQTPKPNHCSDFLLLMNEIRPHRTDLYNQLQPMLDKNIYSYVGLGVSLQNADDIDFTSATWQRYTDPNWYNSTRFSIVAESIAWWESHNEYVNFSEKSLKPCAFGHPSIVLGQDGVLVEMRRLGFETFDHVIDEAYDSEKDYNKRLQMVVKCIHSAIDNKDLFNDSLTQQKIEHNWNHFYDSSAVEKLFVEKMVNPLLEFIES